MTCFFPAINNFSKELIILRRDCEVPSEEEGVSLAIITEHKATISCHSLTSTQKKAAITLIILAVLASLTAACLGPTGLIPPTAAWATGATGLGISSILIGAMLTNHLLFLKEINQFLRGEYVEDEAWNQAEDYPDLKAIGVDTSDDGSFNFRVGPKRCFTGRRYVENKSGLSRFYIEFHRTPAIHKERTPTV